MPTATRKAARPAAAKTSGARGTVEARRYCAQPVQPVRQFDAASSSV